MEEYYDEDFRYIDASVSTGSLASSEKSLIGSSGTSGSASVKSDYRRQKVRQLAEKLGVKKKSVEFSETPFFKSPSPPQPLSFTPSPPLPPVSTQGQINKLHVMTHSKITYSLQPVHVSRRKRNRERNFLFVLDNTCDERTKPLGLVLLTLHRLIGLFQDIQEQTKPLALVFVFVFVSVDEY